MSEWEQKNPKESHTTATLARNINKRRRGRRRRHVTFGRDSTSNWSEIKRRRHGVFSPISPLSPPHHLLSIYLLSIQNHQSSFTPPFTPPIAANSNTNYFNFNQLT